MEDIRIADWVTWILVLTSSIGTFIVYKIQKARIEVLKEKASTTKDYQDMREAVIADRFTKEFEKELELAISEITEKVTDESTERFHEGYYELMRVVLEFLWTSVPESEWESFLEHNSPTNKKPFLDLLRNRELMNKHLGSQFPQK
ncbi:MAG: hypothetical protein H6603_00540 [Flavobacteriales bacterium]|nr:hypothetical protein [Flavobacteriales bacterium]